MSIKMAALSGVTAQTEFTFQGETVNIEYRPNYMTPEREALLAATTDGSSTAFVDMVVGMLVTWDVLDDKGTPLPVTADVVKTLPYSFLAEALKAAGEASAPGEAGAP